MVHKICYSIQITFAVKFTQADTWQNYLLAFATALDPCPVNSSTESTNETLDTGGRVVYTGFHVELAVFCQPPLSRSG